MNKITIFLPISKEWRLEKFIKQVVSLDTEGQSINIVVVIDNERITPERVKEVFASHRYINDVSIISTGNFAEGEFNMAARRKRIMEVFQIAQRMISSTTELVLTIEDDTNFKSDYLQRILKLYNFLSKPFRVGLVSGVQAGRWAAKMLGLWDCDNYSNPSNVYTLPYKKNIVQDIGAAGFYFFITSRDNFVNTELTFGQFGPDVYFGFALKAKGMRNFVDWSLVTGHEIQSGVIYPDEKCEILEYNLVNNIWKLRLQNSLNINS